MSTATITNEDLMSGMQDMAQTMHDMMQITSDGFIRLETRMDGLETRMGSLETRLNGVEQRLDHVELRLDGVEQRLSKIERELQAIKIKLREHDVQLAELHRIVVDLADKHSAYINDIADLLDRVSVLEHKAPAATQAEVKELQQTLQHVVDWAIRTAKITNVPLKLPS